MEAGAGGDTGHQRTELEVPRVRLELSPTSPALKPALRSCFPLSLLGTGAQWDRAAGGQLPRTIPRYPPMPLLWPLAPVSSFLSPGSSFLLSFCNIFIIFHLHSMLHVLDHELVRNSPVPLFSKHTFYSSVVKASFPWVACSLEYRIQPAVSVILRWCTGRQHPQIGL